MKTMTCKQLAGACDEKFQAETFEEMAEKSKKHAHQMALQDDKLHLEKMEEMKNLDPKEWEKWFEDKKNEFDSLPED